MNRTIKSANRLGNLLWMASATTDPRVAVGDPCKM